MFWTNFAQPQQFGDIWAKALKDHFARVEAMQKEFERVEQEGYARTNAAIDESARLAKESVAYAQKLSSDWRRISADAMKKATEGFGVSL